MGRKVCSRPTTRSFLIKTILPSCPSSKAEKQNTTREMSAHTDSEAVVVINYEDLVNGIDLSAQIEAAFGFDGLGLISVRGMLPLCVYIAKHQ
jgi:hypothetical protein